ncbi:MAG: hypothetical protein ACP5Q5_09465 [Brevinematia bacterium]
MERKYFKSEIIKTNVKKVYITRVDSSKIEIEYLFQEKKVKIFLDGKLIEESTANSIEKSIIVGNENHIIKISKYSVVGYDKDIEIYIDNIPVENTPADPYFFISKARYSLVFYVFIMMLKIFLSPLLIFLNKNINFEYSYLMTINLFVYFIPTIIVIIGAIYYKKFPRFSIISGLIIAILEMFDYLYGVYSFLSSDFTNIATSIMWIIARIYAIYFLLKAAINLNKKTI